VVHRDLKPSNVMLVPDESGEETIKILDFGLVKVLRDDSEELTKEGSFLGSPRYMSPEQIAHGRVDLRTDIYSLGVILYQCLCGRPPFEADNAVHILMAHLHTPVPSFRERNPAIEVPESLGALALRCLDKQPDGRPATMDEFLAGLRQCEVALGLSASGTMLTERSMPAGQRPSLAPSPDPSALRPGISQPHALPAPQPVPASHTVASTPPRRPFALVAGLLGLGLFGLAAGVLLQSRFTSRPGPSMAPIAPPLAVSPARPAQYRLEIDSVPSGAVVVEGGNVLGVTPVGVIIDNALVAAAPRRFVLRHPGHQPFELAAAVAEEPSVRTVALLVPDDALAAPVAPIALRPARPEPHLRRPPHAPVDSPGDSDIRLHR
jgi:hypothetical protein